MFKSLVVCAFLLYGILAVQSVSSTCTACGGSPTIPIDNYCAADLTIAMDYTPGMPNNNSVLNLVQFVLQNFTNYLPISVEYANVAVLGYGLQGIKASDMFNDSSDLCDQVQSQCGEYFQDGSSQYTLQNLFKFYASFFPLYARTGIPSKFVVFTSINDQASIEAAATFSRNIQAAGASIIIVGINQINQAWLKELSNITYFINFTGGYDDNLRQFLLTNVCTFDLTTVPPPTTPPAPSGNPLSNEFGTPCSKNYSNLWLDIIVLVDHTESMISGASTIGGTLAAIVDQMTIAQSGGFHYSRVGVVYFDTSVTILANLTTWNNTLDCVVGLTSGLGSLGRGSVTTIDIENALKTAYNMFTAQSNRGARQVVVLFASTFNPSGTDDPYPIAASLTNMGVFIIGVNYNLENSASGDMLKNISAPGMFFKGSDGETNGNITLYTELLDAFTYANCVCPGETLQLVLFDNTVNRTRYYADCIYGALAGTFWQIAEQICKGQNGTLASLTSASKESFVINQVIPQFLNGTKHFHIGLSRTNGQLYWSNYNNTQFPLGSYTNWVLGTNSNSTGDCVFSDLYDGRNWGWQTGPCMGSNLFSYPCQKHACDADNWCDLRSLYIKRTSL